MTQSESDKGIAGNKNAFFCFFCLQYKFVYVTRGAQELQKEVKSVCGSDIKHTAFLAWQGSAEFNHLDGKLLNIGVLPSSYRKST